jgi:hypothetical protein
VDKRKVATYAEMQVVRATIYAGARKMRLSRLTEEALQRHSIGDDENIGTACG